MKRYQSLKIIFILVLAVIPAKAGFTISKINHCQVFLKPSQVGYSVTWHGKCKNAFADELGVARYSLKGQVNTVYYGVMKAGFWDVGVLAQNDGYLAGQFKNNEKVTVKDQVGVESRNVIIRAFQIAAKAATQLSQDFKKQGNKASAQHYRAEAEKLSQQMD